MHTMYNLELITRPRQPDEHIATLSFVELIGPETKVCILYVFSFHADLARVIILRHPTVRVHAMVQACCSVTA